MIGTVLYARSVALSSAPPLFSSSVPCLTTYRSTGSDTFPDVRLNVTSIPIDDIERSSESSLRIVWQAASRAAQEHKLV